MKLSNKFLLVVFVFSLLGFNSLLAQQKDALDHFVKAETLRQQGKTKESLIEYDKAIEKDATNAKFFYSKGLVYMRLKDTNKALACFENSTKADEKYVDGYKFIGKIYEKKHKVAPAVLAYNKVFEYATDDKVKTEYKLKIIRLFYKSGRFTQSGSHLEEVKKIAPQNTDVLYLDGLYQNTMQKYEAAKVSLVKGVGLVIGGGDAKAIAKFHFELGKTHFYLEEYEEAKHNFDEVKLTSFTKRIYKMSPEYHCKLAYSYFRAYQVDKSIKLVEKAVKMRNDYPEAHDLKVKLAASHVDKSTVIDLKKSSIKSEANPLKKAEKLAELIQLELDGGRYEDVLVSVKQYLEIKESNHSILFFKAVAQSQLGQDQESAQTLQAILLLKGIDLENKAKFNFTLGLLYKKMANKEEALKYLKAAEYGSFRNAAQAESSTIK